MINVMIIDDEYLIRELIKNLVDWKGLKLEVVGEVESGKDAMSEIERLNPEIILMDINVPFINGIELSKMIRKRYPKIKIIIITGYGEFEYAKEAIAAKVVGYLVKPINKETLNETLGNVANELRAEEVSFSKVEQAVKIEKKQNKEEFFNTLLDENGRYKNFDLKKEFLKNFGDETKRFLSVFAISIDDLQIKYNTFKGKRVIVEYVKELFFEVVGKENRYEFFITDENLLFCFNCHDDLEKNHISKLEKLKKIMNKKLSCMDDITFSMVVSGNIVDIDELPLTLRKIKNELENRFVRGRGSLKKIERKIEREHEFELFYSKEEIIGELRVGNIKGVKDILNEIFDEIKHINCTKKYVVFIINHLFSTFIEYSHEVKGEKSLFLPKSLELLEDLKSKEFLVDVEKTLNDIVMEFFLLKNNQKNSTQKLLEKAKNIIDGEYHEEFMTVEYIAKKLKVHENYLGNIFKEKFGFTLKSYISNCRLSNAKRIMDTDKELPLYKVAKLIGYKDPYYFSKCFKKKFGITPTKYIENKS